MSIVTGTDFIYLPTRDFERAVEFYGTTLGLHCSARYGKRPGAEFETGNLTLAVIAVEEFGMTFHVNENAIALHVEDIEAARADAGVTRRRVRGRHARHGRLPHGLLPRPGRQRPDAAPSLRAQAPGLSA